MRHRDQELIQAMLDSHLPLLPKEQWARMDPAERVEALTGQSLDKCREILDLPIAMAVRLPTVMSGQIQVIRAILHAVTRMGIESHRLRAMQQEVLGQLIDDFDAEEARRGNGTR